MNIRLDIEYDGVDYNGWQRQPGVTTIQQVLEDCVSAIAGEKICVFGAGRTDSGVHARGQVAHFEVKEIMAPERWSLALNTRLPHTIRVLRSLEVNANFHAQRSALSKVYEYRVLNRSYSSALDRRVYFWPHPVRWDKIREALPLFVGTHDFRAFQSGPDTVKSTVRTITCFELIDEPNGIYLFRIEGNGFLRQMVRNLVGTVLEIGQGVREVQSIEEAFRFRDRKRAGRAVPARGLTLVSVRYP